MTFKPRIIEAYVLRALPTTHAATKRQGGPTDRSSALS